MKNETRYGVISKWSLLPCYQESIIDCKTWFDSFGRILGAGVSFAYTSNVKVNLGSLRNLPLKVEVLDKSDISGRICDLSRNISVVPNPQFPLYTEFLTTFTIRDPLDSSFFTLPADTSPAQCHQSSFTRRLVTLDTSPYEVKRCPLGRRSEKVSVWSSVTTPQEWKRIFWFLFHWTTQKGTVIKEFSTTHGMI
jgi:hypothetical protein